MLKNFPWKSVKNFWHKSSRNSSYVFLLLSPLLPLLSAPLSSLSSSEKTTARNLPFPLGHSAAWRYLWHQESGGVCSFSSRSAWQSLLVFLLLPSGFGSVWTGTPCFLGNHPCSQQTDWTDLPPSAILLLVLPLSQAKEKGHKYWLSSTVKHTGLQGHDIASTVHREKKKNKHGDPK